MVIIPIMSIDHPIVFATSNPHKLKEVNQIFDAINISVQTLSPEAAALPEPVEDGATFPANALIKARYYAKHTNQTVIADDSGLVVDALDGAPGVISARYAGVIGPREIVDPANNQKLIEAIADIPQNLRTARFVCVIALCTPTRTLAIARGAIEGQILSKPLGNNGFGYDPLFFVPHLNKTTAQLTDQQKNDISHRGQAARRLAKLLPNLL